jgi:hypothetical protein
MVFLKEMRASDIEPIVFKTSGMRWCAILLEADPCNLQLILEAGDKRNIKHSLAPFHQQNAVDLSS